MSSVKNLCDPNSPPKTTEHSPCFFSSFRTNGFRIPCQALRVALVPCHSLTLTGRKGIPEVDLETGVHRTLASTGRDLVGLHDTYTCVREHELCVFFNRVYAGRFGELRTSRRAAPDGHRQAPSSVQRTEQQERLALLKSLFQKHNLAREGMV